MNPALGRVLLGVSGWSYADWVGVVYPRSGPETLARVASLVDFIEINASFYNVPPQEVVEGWVERTDSLGTRFFAKLHRDFTHRASPGQGKLSAAAAHAFLGAFAPLRSSGRLDGLLVQFSFRFRFEAASRTQLRWLRDHFAELAPLVLEVRHQSWRQPEAQAFAAETGFHLAALDYPGADSGFAVPDAVPDDLAYYRLHGRNSRAWFDKRASRDQTYDHLYSAAELGEITKRIEEFRSASRTVYVAANNHFRGQAVKVALELAAWRDDDRVEVSALMVDEFPELARIARRAQGNLFGE